MELYGLIDHDVDSVSSRLQQSAWDNNSEDREDEDEPSASDVLAFLDSDKIWSEEEEESGYPSVTPSTFRSLAVRGDMAATIGRLFRHDRVFRSRLRIAITKDMCAEDFLEKLRERSQRLFRTFQRRVAEGTIDPQRLCNVADNLRDVIDRVIGYGAEKGPLNLSLQTRAAQLMVNMLQELCKYHAVIIPDPGRELMEFQRSLFGNLVRSPPPSKRATFFVLEYLAAEVPPAARASVAEQLLHLHDPLRNLGAPAEYLEALRRLLHSPPHEEVSEAESAGEGPSRSAGSAVPARRAASSPLVQAQRQKRQQT